MGFPWWTLHSWKWVRRDSIIIYHPTATGGVYTVLTEHTKLPQGLLRAWLKLLGLIIPLTNKHLPIPHQDKGLVCKSHFTLGEGSNVPSRLKSSPCLLSSFILDTQSALLFASDIHGRGLTVLWPGAWTSARAFTPLRWMLFWKAGTFFPYQTHCTITPGTLLEPWRKTKENKSNPCTSLCVGRRRKQQNQTKTWPQSKTETKVSDFTSCWISPHREWSLIPF